VEVGDEKEREGGAMREKSGIKRGGGKEEVGE